MNAISSRSSGEACRTRSLHPRRLSESASRARTSTVAAVGAAPLRSQTNAGIPVLCGPFSTPKLIAGTTDEFSIVRRSKGSKANERTEKPMSELDARTRWLALYVLCLASLMIVLDVSIVGVALPSIKDDLGFSDTSLAWVVNAYLLTYGGFLLLGGRLGDLYGQRRLFLIGISVFTVASLACGLSTSQGMLVVSRGVQGLGGAVASAVSLSLMINLFTEPGERAKAMGVFGFVASGGGSLGVLLGGIITDVISWHWIFLVNFPIGVVVVLLSLRLLPEVHIPTSMRLDVAGAITITGALMVAVYAIVNANQNGWTSAETLGLLGVALALFVVFILREIRAPSPLVPLRLFKLRNLATADVVGVLWAGAMFAWFFLTALYMQLVLGTARSRSVSRSFPAT